MHPNAANGFEGFDNRQVLNQWRILGHRPVDGLPVGGSATKRQVNQFTGTVRTGACWAAPGSARRMPMKVRRNWKARLLRLLAPKTFYANQSNSGGRFSARCCTIVS